MHLTLPLFKCPKAFKHNTSHYDNKKGNTHKIYTQAQILIISYNAILTPKKIKSSQSCQVRAVIKRKQKKPLPKSQ